jgi:hypothetical protein
MALEAEGTIHLEEDIHPEEEAMVLEALHRLKAIQDEVDSPLR